VSENASFKLSGGALKIIALVTMIIDHFTAIFINPYYNYGLYFAGRAIGRIAFPIYCFLLVEGYFHTRNVKKYLVRLFVFALISEIPFDLAFHKQLIYFGAQNVFFTLSLGLLLVWAIDLSSAKESLYEQRLIRLITALFVLGCAYYFNVDYNVYGILLVYLFYLTHKSIAKSVYVAVGFNLFLGLLNGNVQFFGILSGLFILLYNGKKGVSLKYFFYIVYPVHLLVFYIIHQFI